MTKLHLPDCISPNISQFHEIFDQITHVVSNISYCPCRQGWICKEQNERHKIFIFIDTEPRYSTLSVFPQPCTLVSTPAILRLCLESLIKKTRRSFRCKMLDIGSQNPMTVEGCCCYWYHILVWLIVLFNLRKSHQRHSNKSPVIDESNGVRPAAQLAWPHLPHIQPKSEPLLKVVVRVPTYLRQTALSSSSDTVTCWWIYSCFQLISWRYYKTSTLGTWDVLRWMNNY